MRSAVVAVGNELLVGRTVNGNAAWLGRMLAELGAPVVEGRTVGDRTEDIRDAIGGLLGRVEIVLVTGGLGPTKDDVTRGAAAGLLGRDLELDDDLLRGLEKRFRRSGHEGLPERTRSQALVPRGATVLPNPHGTAPGLLMEHDGCVVVLLPGVPREMRGIVEEHLPGELEERFQDRLVPILHRTLHTTGIAESVLAERVESALPEDRGGVEVAYLPDVTGVDLRLTVRAEGSGEEARRELDRIEEALEPVVEEYRYEAPEGDLVEAVADLLREGGHTLSVAESCTGGLLGARLTRFAGASDFFLGGVIAYADAVKRELLGVPEDLLREKGAVSGEVAEAMARGVMRRTGSDCAISVTGIAGPGGGTEEKPVGTVFWAAAVGEDVRIRDRVFPGRREDVRERSGQAGLDLLRRMLGDAS